MRIFIAHSAAQSALFQSLKTRLRVAGHQVFDPDRLPRGEGYDKRIKDEIDATELMLFLVSKESIKQGNYALTELNLAEERWPNPAGRIIGIIVDETDNADIPPYLRAVSVVRPTGNIEAEVIAQIATVRTDSPPTKPPGNLFVEQILFGLHPKVRLAMYVVVILAILTNLIAPTVIRGQLFIKAGGQQSVGEDYVIATSSDVFRVNRDGRWVLRTQRRIPGSLRATLSDPSQSSKLNDVLVPMPWPIIGALTDDQISITYDRDTGEVSVVSQHVPPLASSLHAAATRPERLDSSSRAADGFHVRITSLTIREAGDGGGQSELFFRILVDGAEFQSLGFPSRAYRGTYLLIRNSTTTTFRDLGFRVRQSVSQAPIQIALYLYDWDPCILCINNPDDLVGLFKFSVDKSQLGRDLVIQTENALDPDHTYPSGNSSIHVAIAQD